ncbi:hypothetical protein J4228_01560 [Candidatus Woesearchaeota archaeon]|nr:hypothetical protein [Candidatus Woesearchaeota archaeon]
MNRKADANMWWIIIGMAMALLVMILLLIMFREQKGKAELGLFDCESKGGSCDPECPDGYRRSLTFQCPAEENQGAGAAKEICCFAEE